VLFVLALLTPSMAAAEAPDLNLASSSALSPDLEALATPAVRSRSLAGQAEALGLPSEGAGGMVRDGGRVVVEARFQSGAAAAVEAVKAAGAKVLNVSDRYQTLVLSVAPADLPALAAVPGVVAVTPSLAPEAAAPGGASTAAISSNGLCEGGSVISQGVAQLNVAAARDAFGPRGAGMTIGVISDSFDEATTEGGAPIPTKAHEDELTNDLPGRASTCSGQHLPVNVIAEEPINPEEPPTDEGRAMLQAVHDLAPHARLAFATGAPAEISYAENIERLAAPVSQGGAGADVIVDDLAYPTEPDFQDGPVADAIRRVTEKGVLYFSAAGNDNLFNAAGDEIASWEAPRFRGEPNCNANVVALLSRALVEESKGPYQPDCMDFDPGTGPAEVDTEFGITVEPNSPLTVNLQWAEPWFGVKTALFAALVVDGPEGEEIADIAGNTELTEKPVIVVGAKNTSAASREFRLVIARCAGALCNPKASATADPRIKVSITQNGGGVSETEYPRSAGGDIVGPVIYGHRGSSYVTTIGAVNYQESSTAPKAPEAYSSRGPVTHYFDPVSGTTPAAPLGAPKVIQKPDITATDCASNTFFGIFARDGWHFCGSSQAAEHAATIAALMRQTAPLATPAKILSSLETTATKFTAVTSPNAVGAGMVNALAAIEAVGGAPVEDPPSHVVESVEEEEKAGGPSVRITNGPAALSSQNRPTFEFTSTRPVAFTCQLDGGTPQPCASPYVVPATLADGSHGFAVTGKDAQGRTGSSGVYAFSVDTKAPRTRFAAHPKKIVKTRKKGVAVHFRLKASESPVTFYCQFDKEPLRICQASFRHRFKKGKHAVRVRAKDQAGNIAERPTVFHFRVKVLPSKHHAKKSRHSR
jgi:hypothetical protein